MNNQKLTKKKWLREERARVRKFSDLFVISILLYLCSQDKYITIMTAIELNAELYRAMGEIADNKSLLDAALAKFHKDWGGEGSAMEIAEELRNGRDNSRTVETW